MKTSLIISTYNRPKALALVLKSVLNQAIFPDEVLIADDGSRKETKIVVDDFRAKSKFPVHHIWHEDKGFRVSKIRNKAIEKSIGDYLIQIDGDCVLNRHFIKDHINLAEKGSFISGSRVLLNEKKTKEIIESQNIALNPFSDGIKNRLNATRCVLAQVFIKKKKEPIENLMYKIRGCNMSFWRQDLIDVNGYEEQFEGWGREDSELTLRLLKKGLSLKRIKMFALQFHLYHEENDRSNFDKNHELMMKSLERNTYKALKGIEN